MVACTLEYLNLFASFSLWHWAASVKWHCAPGVLGSVIKASLQRRQTKGVTVTAEQICRRLNGSGQI